MPINSITKLDYTDLKTTNSIQQFNNLVHILNEKELTAEIVDKINIEVQELNASPLVGSPYLRQIKKKQLAITKILEKQLKLVPKNYYRNLWMVLGMSIFGLPIGFLFGTAIGNLGLVGVGLPIGMSIGLGLGINFDKKAFKEGRQLDIELK